MSKPINLSTNSNIREYNSTMNNKLDAKKWKSDSENLIAIELVNKFEPILTDEEDHSNDNSTAPSNDDRKQAIFPQENLSLADNTISNTTNDVREDGWKVMKNKKTQRKKVKDQIEPDEDLIEADETGDNGSELKFKHKWKVWVHLNDSAKWDKPSFDADFFIIDSVGSFLQFFNNFYKFNLKMYSFYIMKSLDDGSYVVPTWEDPLNRNGGTCSLRIDMIHGIELMPLLCILIFNECLIPDMTQINGISFNTKTNWALIKLWTKDKDVDITKMLPDAIINSYPSLCIKHKANTPEY